jgi:DNA-binding NarL/FixJ family response regulator
VTAAKGADAGLRVLEKEAADAVVLDYCMPGKNGQVVAEVVRARWPAVRVVMLSGCFDVPHCAKASVDAFVSKNDTLNQLRSTLDRLLRSVRR